MAKRYSVASSPVTADTPQGSPFGKREACGIIVTVNHPPRSGSEPPLTRTVLRRPWRGANEQQKPEEARAGIDCSGDFLVFCIMAMHNAVPDLVEEIQRFACFGRKSFGLYEPPESDLATR